MPPRHADFRQSQPNGGAAARQRSGYMFEFLQQGGIIRVCAIDPVTGTEITMVGSARASQADLKRVAARKLDYVLAKMTGAAVQRRAAPQMRGLVV